MSQSTTSSSEGRHKAALAIAGFVAAAALAILLGWAMGIGESKSENPAPTPATGNQVPAGPSSPLSAPSTTVNAVDDKDDMAKPEALSVAAIASRLQFFATEFRALMDDKTLDDDTRKARARSLLGRLRDELHRAPADAAAAAIIQFLDSGADSATGLGFSLAGGGVLNDAPSLRTALLDMLGQLDPNGSVSYARKIFDVSHVADEWALAMRNMGWQNQEGSLNAELRARMGQLLDNQSWLANPSQGFLEAFDVAVHLGGLEDLANMASVMHLQSANGQPVENGTTHAAYVALDRIVTRNPAESLTAMANDPQILAWAPEHRGALMARADVTQPAQRSAIEAYLGTLGARPQELDTFTSLFPNRNGLLGNALISTPREEPGFEQLLAQDRAALAAVQQWLQSGRFGALETNLRTIESRLTGFIRDATASGDR